MTPRMSKGKSVTIYQSPFFIPALRLVGLAGLVVGVAMFILAGSRAVSGWGSQYWPSVPGTIVWSSAYSQAGQEGASAYFKADIIYEYLPPFHDGYTHILHGNNFSYRGFIDAADDSYDPKDVRLMLRRYPVGKPVLVYYNPKNPGQSVLRSGEDLGTFSGSLIGLIAACVGVLLLLGADALTDKLMSFFRRLFLGIV